MIDDRAHKAELARIKRQRLQILEDRQAKEGYACPPEVRMEIEDLRAELAQLDALLRDAARRLIPPLLPYLVDRADQELCLDEALQRLSPSRPRPVVCLIHGDEFQCHDTYLNRLLAITLPRLLKLDPASARLVNHPLEWPIWQRQPTDVARRLQRGLAEAVLNRSTAPIEDISAALAAYPTPVVIHTHLLTEDWQQHGSQGMLHFLRFWQSWPELAVRQVLIVLVFVKYQVKQNLGFLHRFRFQRMNAGIARELDALAFDQFDRLICTVLPQLSGITRQQAEHWARSDETREFCAGADLFSAIRGIYERWEQQASLNTIPMEPLANQLIEALQHHVLQRKGSV